MLLSYNRLNELREQKVINCLPCQINGSSIDITLDRLIETERQFKGSHALPIDISNKKTIHTKTINLTHAPYAIHPGEFILASSYETFNLPNNISAEYKLKSSMARCGLEHLNAGWCDAGWSNSKLTLELKNMTQYHQLQIVAGMRIGQIVFFEHAPVPDEANYKNTGRYNGQKSVTKSKGVE